MVLATLIAPTVLIVGLVTSYALAVVPWWLAHKHPPRTPRMWHAHLARGCGYLAWVTPFLATGCLAWAVAQDTPHDYSPDWITLLVYTPILVVFWLFIILGWCFMLALEVVGKGDEWRDEAVAREAVARKAEQEAERHPRASLP